MTKSFVTDKYNNNLCNELDLHTTSKGLKVKLDPNTTYQTWLGFGGAFTEAACYNLLKLDLDKRIEAINDYFSENGLNYNLARIPMASSDFSLGPFDYLESGKLDYSRLDKYFIDTYKLVNKDIIFLVSPWSPPAFMKDNKKRNYGGKLLDEYYEEYAEYYISFLKHLVNDLKLNVEYLTIQNEPAATQTWDSCLFSPEEEFELAKILAKLLKEAGLDIKILVWDHNRDIMEERVSPIYDLDKDNIIYGAAIHWYDNEPYANIAKVHNKYPNKHIIHTESCIEGGPHYNFYEGLERYARNIIGDMNAYTEGYIDWNLYLDKDGGPNWVGNMCDAPIMIIDKDKYIKQYSYYGIKHLSHFIKPGMKRIEIKIESDDLIYTAFKDDKKIVIVILNQKEDEFIISLDDNYKIMPRSITTIVMENKDE